MAQNMKICPACKKEIEEKAKKCSNCQKDLEILYWEIEQESGEKLVLTEASAEEIIKDHLIASKLKLTNRCRQFSEILNRVEDGKDYYEKKQEMPWLTLKDYSNKIFSLQVLYHPAKANGKLVARITWIVVGIVVAIAWNTEALLSNGASIIPAILWSILLLLPAVTIIGLAIFSFIVSRIYDLPALAMLFRTYIGMLIGGIVGAVVGWTLGYVIGFFYGLTRKRIIV